MVLSILAFRKEIYMPKRRSHDNNDPQNVRQSITFNTLFSAVGYQVPVSISYLALWLGYASSYSYMNIAFFQLAIFTLIGGYLLLTYTVRNPTRQFANLMFCIQVLFWLVLYVCWVILLADLRFYGLISSFVVFTFIFSRGDIKQTLIITCGYSCIHLACCYLAINILGQPGDLRYEVFLTYQFFLVYLFLGWMGLRIFNQKRALVASKDILESTKQELEQALAVLKKAAFTDTLTGLFNRRAMNQVLEARSKSSSALYTDLVIMCDIDNFKNINDSYGHECGDIVLKSVSNKIKNTLRKDDCIARWGGEEFLILLDETDMKTGDIIANQLRELIKEDSVHYNNQDISVTMSLGLSVMCYNSGINESIRLADNALYKAKKSGKDRVCLAFSKK